MNQEMQVMSNFDVFTENTISDLTPEQLSSVISTQWVKVGREMVLVCVV